MTSTGGGNPDQGGENTKGRKSYSHTLLTKGRKSLGRVFSSSHLILKVLSNQGEEIGVQNEGKWG